MKINLNYFLSHRGTSSLKTYCVRSNINTYQELAGVLSDLHVKCPPESECKSIFENSSSKKSPETNVERDNSESVLSVEKTSDKKELPDDKKQPAPRVRNRRRTKTTRQNKTTSTRSRRTKSTGKK